MDNFSPIDPVFIEPDVASQFISFINNNSTDTKDDVSETEIWKWLRTPPLETVVRCLLSVLNTFYLYTDGLSRVNTLKCTREELVENLSSFMSESNQNFIVKPHAEVTDAIVIVEDKVKSEATSESSPQGYVVVGEMCGLAVMRGAQVFSPGLSLYIF